MNVKSVEIISHIFVLARERSLFMTGVETEEKVLCVLKKVLPQHLLKSNCLYPTTENS